MASSSRDDRTPLLSSDQPGFYGTFETNPSGNARRRNTIVTDTEPPLLSWKRFRDSFVINKSSAYIVSSAIVAMFVLGSVLIILVLGLGRLFGLLDPGSAGRLHGEPAHAFETLPSARSVRSHLRHITEKQHLAGKGRELAEWMAMKFESYELSTETKVYYPYLNYPAEHRVAISEPPELAFEAQIREDIVPEDPTSWRPDEVPAFHGYSASGEVTARLVYVNYGRQEDFKALEQKGISVKGKIVLARYGKIFRGLKVRAAEELGAVGVLIYSDPADDGFGRGKVYPEGPFRPESGIQRGSVQYISIYPGDPLTPGIAATEEAPRLRLEEALSMPKIPSLPLSYGDVYPLLRALAGEGVRVTKLGMDWEGGLNISYWSGPSEAKVQLTNRVTGDILPIYNVIATIPGEEEPDREVILGNHRDAWVFGAVDPGSGSASLLEIARTFGVLLKRGWRPRRTLKLCSWDAEEYGLVGSTEYVEDHAPELHKKAVAYINVDTFEGSFLSARGSPSLQAVFERVAKNISDPSQANRTLYDNWVAELGEPRLAALGSGSDYTPFFQHLGVASLDLGFHQESGVYHSNYDSFHYMEKFGDPGFHQHLALIQLWGKVAVALSDDAVLPFNLTWYGHELSRLAKETQASLKGKAKKRGVDFKPVINASQDVVDASIFAKLKRGAHQPKRVCPDGDADCQGRLRAINDQLAFFERKLVDPKATAPKPSPSFEEALEARNWNDAARIVGTYARMIRQAAHTLSL
ncbi:Vacuolar protein sorting-associated protein 70 [Massospora cicadina]|nr:Vacuolar protein sorting-associated protein 70 [Massospora cicadina]